jgi:hypothetical protein
MRQILYVRSEEAQAKGNQNLLAKANPKNMAISIERKPNEHGINSYFFNIECSTPSVSSGFRVTDYHTRPGNEASGNFGKNGFTRNPNAPSNTIEGSIKIYTPKKTNCDQQIKKREKFFTQEIDLYSDRVTLHRALFLISEKVKFNYVCHNGPPNAKTATVNLRGTTLLESLNMLEKNFPGAKWTVRDSGFIVFRQPDNPVDYPEKNPYISSGLR